MAMCDRPNTYTPEGVIFFTPTKTYHRFSSKQKFRPFVQAQYTFVIFFLINRLGKAQNRWPSATSYRITQLIIDTSVFYSAAGIRAPLWSPNIIPFVYATLLKLTISLPLCPVTCCLCSFELLF